MSHIFTLLAGLEQSTLPVVHTALYANTLPVACVGLYIKSSRAESKCYSKLQVRAFQVRNLA